MPLPLPIYPLDASATLAAIIASMRRAQGMPVIVRVGK